MCYKKRTDHVLSTVLLKAGCLKTTTLILLMAGWGHGEARDLIHLNLMRP